VLRTWLLADILSLYVGYLVHYQAVNVADKSSFT